MFQFLLGVLHLASNFLLISRALAKTDAGAGPGVMTAPIRGRAHCAALILVLALLPAGANAQSAYIPNNGDNTVSVIDTATNTVTTMIPVGRGPFGLAVTPDSTKAYVNNQTDGTISVIDTATNTVVATIPVGLAPFGVAITPDGTKAYVANGQGHTVSVIDTATNTVTTTIPDSGGPIGVAITPDGTKVYVTNSLNAVSVIDTVTNTVTTTIPVGPDPHGVAVTPNGTKAYVANGAGNTVSVIDTATNTVIATIPVVGNFPEGVAVTPDGTKAYVANFGLRAVSVIDTATNTVTTTIPVGRDPYGVAVTPDGTKVYVANLNDNTVSVINTATNTVAATIAVGHGPYAFGNFIGGRPAGSPPVAVNETKTTPANTPVTIDLTAGASGNPTSAALVGTPVGGTVSGFPATTATFTPTTGFTGTASFQFTLANAFGTSNTATATITVTPPSPPVAMPLTKTTPQGTPVTIDLTAGATGNPTSAARVGTPVGGTVTGFPATTVTFTPTTGFTGTATFQFTLANAFGTSNTATATITVTLSPLAPVAMAQAISTVAGTPAKIDLRKGATGKPTSAAIVSGPAHGMIKQSGTKVTYTQTACFLGTDSFQFTLANAFGTSNVAKVTINVTAVSTPATAVYLVDPYLLKKVISKFDETNIDLTPLYRVQKWDTVRANGLLADNTSAAIAVIQTNDCANDVSMTTTNGTTLVNYSPGFLTIPPTLGLPGSRIPIANFQNIGGSFFAAALVQAPAVGATYSLTSRDPIIPINVINPITVTAVQGSTQQQAMMNLVIPPVVLVHGIWGDRKTLKYYEVKLGPFVSPGLYPGGFVKSIKYQNDIAFDDSGDTGGMATLEKAITDLWKTVDKLQFVGGRVDVVAHSMGGLVARALAGSPVYQEALRGRRQGTIHQIITIDTPEEGTKLAKFLFDNKDATFQNLDDAEVQVLWRLACGTLRVLSECFDKLGKNITQGAVESLIPESNNLKNVPGPADPKWIWNAISSVVPQTRGIGENLLQRELEDFIAAIYPHRSGAKTIDQILDDNNQHDAVVPLASQIASLSPRRPAQSVTFQGRAHTGGFTDIPLFVLERFPHLLFADNSNVLESEDIANLIACWLTKNGAASCNPQPAAAAQAKAQGPALTPKPRVAPANATANNEAMTVQMPHNLQLAIPFELAIAKSGTGLAELAVTQQDEMGHHAEQQNPAITRVVGNTAFVTVIPMLLGSVTVTIEAAFKDGSFSSQDVTVPVVLPSLAPRLFRGDQSPEFSLSLQKGGDVAPLQPEAYYATIPDEKDNWGHTHPVAVSLDGRVDYQIVPTGAAPVVRLEKDKYGAIVGVRALRPGTATIEARFGTAVDHIKVTVEQHH